MSKKGNLSKQTRLLLHHLKPALSAFAVGIGASLAATLLRTQFTQIIRFTVDGILLGDVAQLQAVEACSKVMEQCLRYLDAHFTEDLVLEETARKFGLSRSKFSLLFPQHTGMTFKRYLTKKRIDYAVTLIRSTELPIQEIAQMAGYTDLSTFYRNFTKVTGTAPSTYRCTQDLERHLNLSLGYFF